MMISESHYWKRPLLRAATWLERLRIEDTNEERVLVRVERELFVGFYAIRKVLDTFKISPSTRVMMFEVVWSPCIKPVDYMNAHRIDSCSIWTLSMLSSGTLVSFAISSFTATSLYLFSMKMGLWPVRT
jgi:hypothetical protein